MSRPSSIAIGLLADVRLGKMLQTAAKSNDDKLRPYLRAAHVQPDGVLDLSVEPHEMWFSTTESEQLDLRAGDTVVVEGGVGGYGRAAYVPRDLPGLGFQNSIIRLRADSAADGRYLAHALVCARNNRQIEMACLNAAMPHFTAEKVARFRVPFHEPADRRRIADYLDREVGAIDAMIAKMDDLTDTLRNRRHAVVLGVLATVSSRVRLALIVDVVSGSGFPDKYQGIADEELPFYKVSSLAAAEDGLLQEADNSVSRNIAAELGARIVPVGSVVMAKIGAALLLGRFALTARPACIDNNMQALVPHDGVIDSRFLAYAMEEVSLYSLVKPGPVPSLDVMGMKMTDIAYNPSIKAQRRIADKLDEATARVDAMLAKVVVLKSLLLERRAALITDVVTGKKEVS